MKDKVQQYYYLFIQGVEIGKRKGETYLTMNGNPRNQADLASYNPLILLDRVPVSNLEDFLEVSPEKIQRLEIINDLYVKGGGIVSVFSKKGDWQE
jgi:hypothetical protein